MESIIDSYRFGLVVIGGRRYTSDIIIFPDRIQDNWRRMSGHRLCSEDIAGIVNERPEVVVVGTGVAGLMKILPEVQQAVDNQGIKLIAETTDKACRSYNRLCCSVKVVAALHITC
ncbi:MTH938/NDUFAF3 family protein [Chloroflexota bacterium]